MEALAVLRIVFLAIIVVAVIVEAVSLFNQRRISWQYITSIVLMAVGFTALGIIKVAEGKYLAAVVDVFIVVFDVGWVMFEVTELIERFKESEALLRRVEPFLWLAVELSSQNEQSASDVIDVDAS